MKLGEVVYAYNTAMQESIKHTPFDAMFGRMAHPPVDFNSAKHYDPDAVLKEYCTTDQVDEMKLPARCHQMEQAIKENIADAQAKQKQYGNQRYDATSGFGIGSFVLKKDLRSKREGGKLDYHWQGPFAITLTLGRGLFRLKEVDGDKISIIFLVA